MPVKKNCIYINEPIVVIGIGCRFPGNSDDLEAFWQLLMQGNDVLQEIPVDRWDVTQYYHPDIDHRDKMYVKHGYFLNNIDKFDSQFFGISPAEAMLLDPQHRLLLETSWRAVEDAGINAEMLKDSRTSVSVGIMTNDYSKFISKHLQEHDLSFHRSVGTNHSCAAGRIAHFFGLKGPCLSIDTACSSSLVALHIACQSLRLNECDMALVAGVNVILDPELMISMCRGKMLSPEGRCRSFDKNANGYGRGEGCGVVLLKRYSDALKDENKIYTNILSSAVNHNGSSLGLTVPNGESQRELIIEAICNAEVLPEEIDYIETHGSATPLGDPIEINSLIAALRSDKVRGKPLLLGSVKTNIGHLEAAAGIAALIKVILSLENELLPQHLHFEQLNPYIKLEKLSAEIVTHSVSWPKNLKKPRIAGINSFGMSGTNAHVIVSDNKWRTTDNVIL